MKRTILSICILLSGFAAGAQTMYDALTFSETNYYGTARSISLGNAMTALGGDLGSIGINPAGSAVNPYWQFTMTPGFSFASSSSSVSTVDNGSYGMANKDSRTRFIFPNTGFTSNFDTGNRRGIKRYTFGFVVNTTANHLSTQNAYCSGNDRTSIAGAFAEAAYGVPSSDLSLAEPYNNTSYPWNTILASQSGMISTFDTYTDRYLGVTEKVGTDGKISVAGPLSQRSTLLSAGSRSDMILNFAMDVSDVLYLGFNLGIPTMRYTYNEAFYETAENPSDFALDYGGRLANFKNSSYQYAYQADMDGIYAKFGFIWLPAKGLRIGGAVQSPTAYSINEKWQMSSAVNYTSSSVTSAQTPLGEWSYEMTSPWEVNIGAAYTVGNLGFVSIDYEWTDYGTMRFRQATTDFYSSDPYYVVNRLNELFCGSSHSVRIGAEFKPFPSLALRAGYSLKTSPEKTYTDNLGLTVTPSDYEAFFNEFETGAYQLVDSRYNRAAVNSLSLGVGYSSKGSFFADLGFRVTRYPATYRKPYADYIYDESGNLEIASPLIRTNSRLCDLLLTFGWRF